MTNIQYMNLSICCIPGNPPEKKWHGQVTFTPAFRTKRFDVVGRVELEGPDFDTVLSKLMVAETVLECKDYMIAQAAIMPEKR